MLRLLLALAFISIATSLATAKLNRFARRYHLQRRGINIEDVRVKILQRANYRNKGIVRAFKVFDSNHDWSVDLGEFYNGLQKYGLAVSEDEARAFFTLFNTETGDGGLSYDEFVAGVRGNLNGRRLRIVEKAFKKADKNGDGVLDSRDLGHIMKATEHAKYKNGEWSEARVFKEYLKSFEPDAATRNGRVTRKEFLNYYARLSASVDNDSEFDLMIRNAWKL